MGKVYCWVGGLNPAICQPVLFSVTRAGRDPIDYKFSILNLALEKISLKALGHQMW